MGKSMGRANKVEKYLSAEELQALIQELASLSGNPTLSQIQETAQAYLAKHEVTISLEAARTFKRKNFQGFLDKITGAKERAEALANAITGQEEGDIAAGVGILITEQITELLMQDKDDGYSPKDLESLSKALNLLRSSNQGERLLEARLREYEAKEEEREQKKAEIQEKLKNLNTKAGPTRETLEQIQEQINLL